MEDPNDIFFNMDVWEEYEKMFNFQPPIMSSSVFSVLPLQGEPQAYQNETCSFLNQAQYEYTKNLQQDYNYNLNESNIQNQTFQCTDTLNPSLSYNQQINDKPFPDNHPSISLYHELKEDNSIFSKEPDSVYTQDINGINNQLTHCVIPSKNTQNPQTFLLNIQLELIKKWEIFLWKFTEFLTSKTRIEIAVIDLEKTSKFNYDLGFYSMPEDPKSFIYSVYTWSTHSNKIAQLLQLVSILYSKSLDLTKSTKRELYYNNVNLFKSMENIDSIICDLCSILVIHRFELPIYPSAKGLYYGNISFLNNLGLKHQINLISYHYWTEDFQIDLLNNPIPSFVLIVEKETLFANITENSSFQSVFPNCIIITGKGYPDYLTKVFCKRWFDYLRYHNWNVPFFYFGDNDPHGFEIFLNYLFGSKSSTRENEYMSLNAIKWIGLSSALISNVNYKYNDPKENLINVKSKDWKKIDLMLEREYFIMDNWNISENTDINNIWYNMTTIRNEWNIIRQSGYKAEGEFIISKHIEVFIQNIHMFLMNGS